MSLANAFAGLKKAEDSGAQAPKHLSAEAPKSRGAQVPKISGAEEPKRVSTQAPKLLGAQATAKSADPDFAAVKVYLRKDSRKRAERKWEDQTGGERDFSDLVEELLQRYLGA